MCLPIASVLGNLVLTVFLGEQAMFFTFLVA